VNIIPHHIHAHIFFVKHLVLTARKRARMDGELVGEIEVDEYGNGKATFYVENPTDSVVTVEGAVSLTSGDWRLWVQGPGPK